MNIMCIYNNYNITYIKLEVIYENNKNSFVNTIVILYKYNIFYCFSQKNMYNRSIIFLQDVKEKTY